MHALPFAWRPQIASETPPNRIPNKFNTNLSDGCLDAKCVSGSHCRVVVQQIRNNQLHLLINPLGIGQKLGLSLNPEFDFFSNCFGDLQQKCLGPFPSSFLRQLFRPLHKLFCFRHSMGLSRSPSVDMKKQGLMEK